MEDSDLEQLLTDLESDRVERKESISDGDKIRQAICAFANDLPNHQKPGIVFIGVNDSGDCVRLRITDQLLQTLGGMKSDGNISPFPSLIVQKRTLNGCELAVVIVQPSDAPPVHFKGTPWIRVGPRRSLATPEEVRRLAEKRKSKDLPFDLHPIASATLDDLDIHFFRRDYLPATLSREVLEQNERSIEDQLLALRFVAKGQTSSPTVLGLLVTGYSPAEFIPCAYVQFLRLDGKEITDPIKSQTEIHGRLPELFNRLDELIKANISIASDISSQSTEARFPDYPIVALQQLVRNAVMHRTYEATNAPVRIHWFKDRIEIQNPGGPFGQVTRENFGREGVTDYRNPHLAVAMKDLGYVQRFGVGIALARKEMGKSGNPPLEFNVEDGFVLAIVRRRL